MKLQIDAYWWVSGPPSGRNVLRSIVTRWCEVYPGDTLVLEVRKSDFDAVQADLWQFRDRVQFQVTPPLARPHAVAVAFHAWKRADYDARLTNNFGWRRRRSFTASIVYDAIFADHPEWFTRLERAYFWLIPKSLARSNLIFTISESEAGRLRRVWPDVRATTRSIGLGLPNTLMDALPVPPTNLKPDSRPIILAVGRLNVRKNLGRLIEGFLKSKVAETHQLVVVGQESGLSGSIPRGQRVQFLGHVSDGELRWLYQTSQALAFASLDEGFGLPLLEAAEFGLPAVVSDIPVFRELNLAMSYFDPLDVESIADALSALSLTGSSTPAKVPDRFAWERIVTELRDALIDEQVRSS